MTVLLTFGSYLCPYIERERTSTIAVIGESLTFTKKLKSIGPLSILVQSTRKSNKRQNFLLFD